MDLRAPLIMSLALIAGMLAATAWAWPLIPDGAKIAIHWSVAGAPDGFAQKPMALLVMPAFATVTTAFFAIAPFFTRRRANLAKSSKAYTVGWLGTLLLIAVGHLLVIMHARGYAVNVVGSGTFVIALILAALGNLLGKTHPNPYVGVRTPWTRKSDYSWEMTHRAAGKMFVALGLVTLAALALSDSLLAGRVLIWGMFVVAAVSIALSHFYYRRDPQRGGMH
jgi:uncharacterized membrane protein